MLVNENWIGPNEKLEIRLLSSESSLALFTEHRACSLTGPDPEGRDNESQVGFKKYKEGKKLSSRKCPRANRLLG